MKVFNQVDFGEWQRVADKCEYATFFHTPAWSWIFAETYPEMEIVTKKFFFDDGTKVILPLMKTKTIKGLLSSYISNVAGVYGGIISDWHVKESQINEIYLSLRKGNVADILVVGNPFAEYSLPKKLNTREGFTQLIKLDRSEDEIWINYEYSVRKQINKAKRTGIICKEAINFDEWKEYYTIYREAIKRWGEKTTGSYPLSLFENMFKAQNADIKLWLVIYCGKIVGGNLNLYHNKHCVEWHASFLSDYFRYGIRNYLVHNIILDARAKGYRYYDFNPSGGHKGVEAFKKTFGCEVKTYGVYARESCSVKALRKASTLTRRILKFGSKK